MPSRPGALEPAFTIFDRFRQRNRERMTYAVGLLDQEPDYTARRILRVRPRQDAVGQERRVS